MCDTQLQLQLNLVCSNLNGSTDTHLALLSSRSSDSAAAMRVMSPSASSAASAASGVPWGERTFASHHHCGRKHAVVRVKSGNGQPCTNQIKCKIKPLVIHVSEAYIPLCTNGRTIVQVRKVGDHLQEIFLGHLTQFKRVFAHPSLQLARCNLIAVFLATIMVVGVDTPAAASSSSHASRRSA